MSTRLDGYIRVSRVGDREGDSFIAPKVQREKIEGWARLHDVKLGEVVVEHDVSGGKAPAERDWRGSCNAVRAARARGSSSTGSIASAATPWTR